MATDPGRAFFDSLDSWDRLQQLVDRGETESVFLECKAPEAPQLTRDLKAQFAAALSGYSNSLGGVIVWGLGTTRHPASGLDVITHVVPIGNARMFRQQVDVALPTLAYPTLTRVLTKEVHQNPESGQGVVIAYVPQSGGDPVQSLIDRRFYVRTGEGFVEMPYELIRRMFAATSSPDLAPLLGAGLVEKTPEGAWRVPIIIANRSSAIAEHVEVSVQVLNPEAFDRITPTTLNDASSLNSGRRIFIADDVRSMHRGLNRRLGILEVQPKGADGLKLQYHLYANRMRARGTRLTITETPAGFQIAPEEPFDLY